MRRWRREVRSPRPVEVKPAVEEKPAEEKPRPAADVIEAVPLGIAILDLEGRIIQDNEVARKMFGYERGENIGKLATDLISEEDVPRGLEAFKEGVKKGYYRGFECTGVAKDGKRFPVLVDGTLLKDPEGNPSLSLITFRDITELKRAEEAHAKERAELERAYKELAVFERARTFTFILFKKIFEPLLRQCKPETLVKIRDRLKGTPIATGISMAEDGSVSIDEAMLKGQLAGLSSEESFDKLATTSSTIMDTCYPLIQADLGSEKANELASGVFLELFERPDVSAYKPYLLRVVPEGVEVPRGYILLELGRSYLVEERKPTHASRIFSEMAKYGFPGLCISPTHPADMKREHELGKGVTVLWLSKVEREYSISPSSLGMLRDRITSFAEQNENSVVLLDGVEYLVAINGFDMTLKFLHDLRESITVNRSRLIVTLSPATLGPRELALLERSMEPIEVVEEE